MDHDIPESIDNYLGIGIATTNVVGATNLAYFYLAGVSKQALWSMMNTMQLIIYSTMSNINFPAHTAYFF